MDAFFFIIKSFILTVVLVLALQIKFGTSTLEEHLSHSMRTSGIIGLAQNTADGMSRAIRNGWNFVTGKISSTTRPGERAKFTFERSASYVREKSQEVKTKAENRLREFQESDTE